MSKYPAKAGKQVTVYSSESEVKNFFSLIKIMLRDLWGSRNLAYNLMIRDLKASYRQSLLGFSWSLIPSIVTAITFTLASSNKILNIGKTDMPYPAYILFGTAIWQTFSESVLGPVTSLNSARGFVTKINFPKEALFVAKVGEVVFNFLIKVLLLVFVCILYKVNPTAGVVLSLIVVSITILFGTAIGLLIAPFGMIYQDITKGMPLLLAMGMFLTPVVFPMPTGNSTLAKIVNNNPLSYLVTAFRDYAVVGHSPYQPQVAVVALFSLVLFCFSWLVYRLSLPYVIERC